jgi:hypothetical protein
MAARNRDVTHRRWLITGIGLRRSCSTTAGKTINPTGLRGLEGSGPNDEKGNVGVHPLRGFVGVGKRVSRHWTLSGHGG